MSGPSTARNRDIRNIPNEVTLVPLVGVGAMILKEGKVLLGRRRGSHGSESFGWPGGHLKFGETLEQGVTREVFEETGLVVTSLKFLCISNIIDYGKHYLDIQFLAEVEPGQPKVLEPDRVESWDWYSLNDLPSPLFKPNELAIRSYLTGQLYNP